MEDSKDVAIIQIVDILRNDGCRKQNFENMVER